jgi:hypothetical protein
MVGLSGYRNPLLDIIQIMTGFWHNFGDNIYFIDI